MSAERVGAGPGTTLNIKQLISRGVEVSARTLSLYPGGLGGSVGRALGAREQETPVVCMGLTSRFPVSGIGS